MTTAYTSLLGLALPVTGELSGTWGDTVNNSITSLLDTSVAGTTNVSTDTDVTLTTTTGAANTARQAILLFSGARTALRTVTAPAQSKIYTVINATTGGFSVKLVGAGPTTGVTIVAGESAVCAWNGSDFIKISNTGGSASFVNLTASGTVTFTGLTASRAVFTNASDELVSNAITGTGNVVMSASPTLTGTISAAAATLSGNLTLSGGTANGVAYLNGSKVVTSGSALTFDGTNLLLGTTAALNTSATLRVKTASNPTAVAEFYGAGTNYSSKIVLANDANAAAVSAESGNLAFFTGGWTSEQMRLTSTGLGIGTSSPSAKLEVKAGNGGQMALNNDGSRFTTALWQNNGTSKVEAYWDQTNTLFAIGPTAASSALVFQTVGSERMRLDSSGNLGISTSSPSQKLDVVTNSNSGTAVQLSLRNTSNGTNVSAGIAFGFNSVAADPDVLATIYGLVTDRNTRNGALTFSTAASGTLSERARISSTGNFLVNTTGNGSPGLGVANSQNISFPESTNNTSLATMFRQSSSGDLVLGSGVRYSNTANAFASSTGDAWARTAINVGYGAIKFFTAAEATVAVGTDTTLNERARINSSGNLLVGTTSTYSSERFIVDSNGGSASYNSKFVNSSTSNTAYCATTWSHGQSGTAVGYVGVGGSAVGNTAFQNNFVVGTQTSSALVFNTSDAERVRIDSTGDFLVGTTSSVGTSKFTVVTASNRNGICIQTGDNANYSYLGFNTASTLTYYVLGTGSVYNSTGTYGTISDARLKENIVDATPKLDDVMRLQVRNFNFKTEPNEKQLGFIAQELEQVFPALVEETSEKDAEGNATGEKTKQVKTSVLVPVLVKAMQEQQAIIESLKARLDAANL